MANLKDLLDNVGSFFNNAINGLAQNVAQPIQQATAPLMSSQFGTTIGNALNAPFRFDQAQQQQQAADTQRYQLLNQAHQAFLQNPQQNNSLHYINAARAIPSAYGNPVQSLQQEYSQPQYQTLGVAKQAFGTLGEITHPIQSLSGAPIGVGFNAVDNAFHGQPLFNNWQQAAKSGENISAELGPLSDATGVIGNPLLSKIPQGTAVGKIGVAGLKSALPFAAQSALEPAKNAQERLANAAKGFGTGFAFGATSSALGLGANAVKNKIGGNEPFTILHLPSEQGNENLAVKLTPEQAQYFKQFDEGNSPLHLTADKTGSELAKKGISLVSLDELSQRSPYLNNILNAGDTGKVFQNVNASVLPQTPPDNMPQTEQPVSPELPQATNQVSSSLPDSIQPPVKQRGFTGSVQGSNEVSPQVQEQVSGTYIPKSNQELLDNTTTLVGKKLSTATNNVIDALSAAPGKISDQTVSDAIGVAKAQDAAGNTAQATKIYDQLAEHLTEAGRTVQAASLLNNRTPQGLMYSAVNTFKKAGVEVTPDIQSNLDGLINVVKDTAPNTDERNIATQRLANFVNQNIPRSKWDAAAGIWKTGLLTGPETVTKVAVSHAISTPADLVSQIPASLADHIMSIVTGKRSTSATLAGAPSGFVRGLKAVSPKISQGIDMPNTGGFASDFGSSTTRTGYEAFVGNVHGALPKPAYSARFDVSLNDQALTEATNQGLKGAERTSFIKDFLANPPVKAQDIAKLDAEIATNMEQTGVGKLASNLQKWKLGPVPVGQFLAPFTRVPSAIGVNGIGRYTPFGISGEVVNQISSGVFDQRTMAQAFGRSATGTTVLALGALLASKGLVTLKAPSDAKERALWDTQGKTPNSINFGGKWISLNAFGPLGISFAVGAGLQQSLEQNGGDIVKAIPDAVATGGRVLLDQPYLKGISGLANALNDPSRYGTTFFNNTAGSVVPAAVQQVARGTDTVQRMFPKDLGGKFASEIPGLRQGLPVSRDLYGNSLPGSNPDGSVAGGVSGTLNPFYPSQAKSDPVSSELQRLYDTLGSQDAPNIAQLSPSQTVYGQKVKLTNQQISDIVAQSGPKIQQALTGLMSNPAYSQLTDLQKSQVITKAVDQFKQNDYMLQNVINSQQGQGISPNSQSASQIPGVSQTPSGVTGLTPIGATGTMNQYQLQAAKDAFANSNSNFQDLGNYVLRKDASGSVVAMTKDAFNSSLYEAQLTQATAAKDSQTVQAVGSQLLDLYNKQLADPNVDQLDKVQIQNKVNALTKKLGGGTAKKPKKISVKSTRISAPKSIALKRPAKPAALKGKTLAHLVIGGKVASIPKFKIPGVRNSLA